MAKKAKSIFKHRSLQEIYDEIKGLYLSDKRPWIIGYSGGKDSTAVLQLIWHAISQLPKKKRTKHIYVISSDTLVESPPVGDHIMESHEKINTAAKKQGLPFSAEKVSPIVEDTFWVNLIGKGYPAPNQTFRWCTDRMKIRPADRFITTKVSEFGEVIVVLGMRKGESMSRDQLMNMYKIKGSLLSKHSKYSWTYVYTPIEDWTVNDVWTYLLQMAPNPWGNNNRDLAAMYKSATDGECPLVVDDSTPSCGNSRFGCWTCTVVQKDRSMEAMIDAGEEWMEPLLEIRDHLSMTQDPERKFEFRDFKRRNGQARFHRDLSGRMVPGPYFLDFRRELLRKILEAQQFVREHGPDKTLSLILPEELHEIRRIWLSTEGDWKDSMPKIYREVTGDNLNWQMDDLGSFSSKDQEKLTEVAHEVDLPPRLLMKLMEAERRTFGMRRRSAVYKEIESVLNEEWRSKEQVLKAHQSKLKVFGEGYRDA